MGIEFLMNFFQFAQKGLSEKDEFQSSLREQKNGFAENVWLSFQCPV